MATLLTPAPTTASGQPLSRPQRMAGRLVRRADALWQVPDRVFLAAMAVVAVVLRVPRLGIRYWGDEAISIGIASRPLHEIPRYLRFDGSPPLYYVLLHYWMAVFGTSEVATHTLSLILSLMVIPAAWWCARTLFGSRAAKPAALLASVFPYLVYYGTETRMYVLVALLSMVAVTAWVRALQTPGRRWLWGAVAASVAVLYTHNWGLFLVAACVVVGLAAARLQRNRALQRRSLVYAAAVTVAYLPWLPSFWWQLHSTGAPWAPRPGVLDFFADPVFVALSGGSPVMFAVACPLTLVAVAAAILHLRRSREGSQVDGAATRWAWLTNSALAAGAALVVTTAALGWVAGQFVHSWAPRYLGVALGPLVVMLAGLFGATGRGRRWLCLAAVGMVATALPVLFDPPAAADSKSNVARIDAAMRGQLAPGDVVITTAMSELPVIAYYLPKGLRYATPLGLVTDPRIVDWQDLSARLSAADPTTALARILTSVPVGGHVLLIDPLSWASTEEPPEYQGTVAAEGIAVNNDVLQDPAYAVVQTVRPVHAGDIANPVEGVLFVKTG
jgi:mannosyltransferase